MNVTKEEYLAMQAARQQNQNQNNYQSRPRISYLSLDNGQSAVVRFAYSNPDEIYQDVVTCHSATVNGKFRKVSCLRKIREPIEKCPMCAAGDRYSNRVYIRLLEYTRDDNGNIVATPKVFDRPAKYKDILEGLFTEYGDISNQVFKITRIGEKGSQDTQYPIMLCNSSIYNEQLYKKDFSAFDGYKVVGGPVLEKSYDDMVELANNVVPQANTYQSKAAQDAVQAVVQPGSYYDRPAQPTSGPSTTVVGYYDSVTPSYQPTPNTNTISYAPQDALADAQQPRRVPIYQ